MTSSTLVDRLLEAVFTEKQDAIANGTDGSERVRQRLDALVDAIGLAELAQGQAAYMVRAQAIHQAGPVSTSCWLTLWRLGRRR